MQTIRSDPAAATPFRAAFADARREASRAVGVAIDPAPEDTSGGVQFEARIEKRLSSRAKDVALWNELGRHGWQLVAVNGKHAFFRRAHRAD